MYRKKYDDAGIRINDIKTLQDIVRLPTVGKDDLRKPPEETLPPEFDIAKSHLLYTSGTTGEPLGIHYDTFSRFRSIILYMRWYRIFDVQNFMNLNITNIGGFTVQHSFDEAGLQKPVFQNLQPFRFLFPLHNFQNIYVGDIGEKPQEVAHKLDAFNPDVIISYPGTLRDVATLKKEGMVKTAQPKFMVSAGGMLDIYTENFIRSMFDCEVIDFYGSTEGDTVACRCREGNYHIAHDVVHIEALDDSGEPVAPGEPGNIVMTRLFGNGTPIIRFDGLGDLITLSDETCSCGLNTPLIKTIEGRTADTIVLPDGRKIPPTTFCFVLVNTLYALRTERVQRYQIVQETKNTVDILLIEDETIKEGPSFETIMDEVSKNYHEKFGDTIQINVKKVTQVIKDRGIKFPSSLILSKIKH
jgi:phenylacetate-CoA ligase